MLGIDRQGDSGGGGIGCGLPRGGRRRLALIQIIPMINAHLLGMQRVSGPLHHPAAEHGGPAHHGGHLHALQTGLIHLGQPLRIFSGQGGGHLLGGGGKQIEHAGIVPPLVGNGDPLLKPLLRPFFGHIDAVFGQCGGNLFPCGFGCLPCGSLQKGGNARSNPQGEHVHHRVSALDKRRNDRLIQGGFSCRFFLHARVQ